ncbi:MAG: ral nucleoside transport system permease protein [Thermoleophilaceae bacterium]|nr:ral nucleoside transport system permease protein [Thermoleophilaceae bacterium]
MSRPGFRLQRRTTAARHQAAAVKVVGALAALLLAGIVLQLSGRPTLDLASAALDYNLGDWFGIEETLLLAAPIVLGALAVYLCFRIRLWNIGIDGQMSMGAVASAAVGLHVDGPEALMLAAMVVAGALGGALWALIPGVLRAYFQINEIITTLLLNLVALQIVVYLSVTAWADGGVSLRSTSPIPYEVPMLSAGLDVGVLVPLLVAGVLALVLGRSRWGYETTIIGANARAGEAAGMSVRRRIVLVMMASGAIAGLSGMLQVAGRLHVLSEDVAANTGLYGFIVAALAGASIVAIIVVGVLIAMLLHSGISLATDGVSTDVVVAVYGLILLLASLGEVAARYRLIPRRRSRPAE